MRPLSEFDPRQPTFVVGEIPVPPPIVVWPRSLWAQVQDAAFLKQLELDVLKEMQRPGQIRPYDPKQDVVVLTSPAHSGWQFDPGVLGDDRLIGNEESLEVYPGITRVPQPIAQRFEPKFDLRPRMYGDEDDFGVISIGEEDDADQ